LDDLLLLLFIQLIRAHSDRILDFILLSIPSIGNVTILIFFCIYIFTIIGVNLFAKLAYNNSYYEDSNFRSFGSAFVTLFRMTTADNWYGRGKRDERRGWRALLL
jgi:hypothetical protein